MNKVPRSDLASVTARQTLSKGVSPKYAREIAAYLLAENRTSELQPLLRDIQSLWAEAGYVNATAISARPLTSASKSLVKSKISKVYPKAKQIIIGEQIDESVIAGMRIEMSDSQLDVSVASQLNKFKQLTTKEG